MRLSDLVAALPPELGPLQPLASSEDPVIRGLGYDSRAVAPGELFVALRGTHHDGHDYLADALRLGAAALVVERLPDGDVDHGAGLAAVHHLLRAEHLITHFDILRLGHGVLLEPR